MIKMLNRYCFLMAGISLVLYSCSQDQPKKNFDATAKKPAVMAPFRFHKMIEVSPGQDFDVMSWGRGASTTGSLLILHSDSAAKKFTTTTGDLDGAIVDVFNVDMDVDGNPELLIEAKAKDTIQYTSIYAYEFNDNNVNKLDFPKLTTTQKKGYRGEDNFYMKDARLIREFPIYDGNTSAAKPTGQKRVLEYNMRSNNLTAKDLSADTLKNNSTPIKPAAADNKTQEKKTGATNSNSEKPSTKHKKETPKKKKKHHRHHSDD
jgi:hypothetical protein